MDETRIKIWNNLPMLWDTARKNAQTLSYNFTSTYFSLFLLLFLKTKFPTQLDLSPDLFTIAEFGCSRGNLFRRFFSLFFFIFFCIFCIFVPLPPLRGQPAVAMPILLAPQEGTDMLMQVGGCRIRTRDYRRTVRCANNQPPHPHLCTR